MVFLLFSLLIFISKWSIGIRKKTVWWLVIYITEYQSSKSSRFYYNQQGRPGAVEFIISGKDKKNLEFLLLFFYFFILLEKPNGLPIIVRRRIS